MSAAAPPPVAGRLDEFSDRISPMLVKELRQGLRSKSFVILFLALQALLALVILVGVGANSSSDAGRVVSQTIFFFFSFAALVAQPLRGIGALHQEIKGNTIDLMVLTRLGAWRIVLGKWVAIVSQTALLLTAVAPYLILRYFFGRMDLFAELLLLLLLFLGSAALTAFTVGLSAVSSVLIRGLLPLGIAMWISAIIMSSMSYRTFDSMVDLLTLREPGTGWGVLTALLFAGYFGWTTLAMGASMIAPMAENHSTPRRLVALGTMAILALMSWAGNFPAETMDPLLMCIVVPALTLALSEPLQLLPPICRPFLRFGPLGRLAGIFLYPGWPSGVFFSGLLVAVMGAIVGFNRTSYTDQILTLFMIAGIATLFFAGVVVRLLGSKGRSPLGIFILAGVISVAVAVGLALISEQTTNDGYLWLFCWVPPVLINIAEDANVLSMWADRGEFYTVRNTGIAVAAGYYLLLLALAIKKFPAVLEVERQAKSPDPS